MAQGFGAPSAKPKGLTEKGQWKTYQALVLKGEPTVSVMVRIPDKKDAKWYGVGRVNAGGEGTIAQAIEHQKRLIMEHARRVHAPLKGFKGAFDIGLQADPELEPFVHTNERVEVPPMLVAGLAAACGKPAARKGLGQVALRAAPPVPGRAQGGHQPRLASANWMEARAPDAHAHAHAHAQFPAVVTQRDRGNFPPLGSRACPTPRRGCT